MDLSPDEDQFQGRLLHQAALWDNEELLLSLLAGGADPDARDARARCALHAAALAERSRCLRALVAAGASVDAREDDATGGKTALHIAAERGHAENVRALLAAGASLSARDAAGATALQLAERAGHRAAARELRSARDALERERLAQHAVLRELVLRGDAAALRARLATLGASAPLCVNLTPQGANTLLYVAVEAGHTAVVKALQEAGADGRAHPVTKYSPLYIACYHGHKELVPLLLQHFPEAVQQETMEKWLPLHAACIGGHAALVTLLLEYPYPASLLSTYTDETGKWQYEAAFDVNALDARGQSALYVASTLGCSAVLDALLAHSVPAREQTEEVEAPLAPRAVLSPQRGISLGIHAIVSRLTGASSNAGALPRRVHPVRVSAGRGADSCVACAARGGHAAAVRRLLQAGASAAASAAPPEDESTGTRDSRRRSRSASAAGSTSPSPSLSRASTERDVPWTALAVAVRNKHVQVADMLLRCGADDPHGLALRECLKHRLVALLAAILASRVSDRGPCCFNNKHVQVADMLLRCGADDPHGLALRECLKHRLVALLAAILASRVSDRGPCCFNNKHVQVADMLLRCGADDPHGLALRECLKHRLVALLAAILASRVSDRGPCCFNNKHVQVADMLLRCGADDPHGLALRECLKHRLVALLAAILASRVSDRGPCCFNNKHVQVADMLLRCGADDPHGLALRECLKHRLVALLAAILASRVSDRGPCCFNNKHVQVADMLLRCGADDPHGLALRECLKHRLVALLAAILASRVSDRGPCCFNNKHVQVADMLLRCGADDPHGLALRECLKHRLVALLAAILASRVSDRGPCCFNNKHVQVADMLLRCGADDPHGLALRECLKHRLVALLAAILASRVSDRGPCCFNNKHVQVADMLLRCGADDPHGLALRECLKHRLVALLAAILASRVSDRGPCCFNNKHVQVADMLLRCGADDPHGLALRECLKHRLVALLAAILASRVSDRGPCCFNNKHVQVADMLLRCGADDPHGLALRECLKHRLVALLAAILASRVSDRGPCCFNNKHVQVADMLLRCGADDPHGLALRECLKHRLVALLAAILASRVSDRGPCCFNNKHVQVADMLLRCGADDPHGLALRECLKHRLVALLAAILASRVSDRGPCCFNNKHVQVADMLLRCGADDPHGLALRECLKHRLVALLAAILASRVSDRGPCCFNNKHVQVADMLLRCGADDPHGLALRECLKHRLVALLAAILASRAYPDPEFKMNKSAVSAKVLQAKGRDSALTHNALVPKTPVMVHWRALHTQMDTIRMSWLSAAALRVNPQVSGDSLALHAITRLELAQNELRTLPAALFSLLSLRYLNVAANKLERLPRGAEPAEEEGARRRPAAPAPAPAALVPVYTAPVLQELYLQDNRLEQLPPELFSLPALATLDVSNNKLRALPSRIWDAPALRDLNAALNHLRDLPTRDTSETPPSPSEASPALSASPSASQSSFNFTQSSESSRRSVSSCASVDSAEDDTTPTLADRSGHAVCSEAVRAHPWRAEPRPEPGAGACALASLNLAHNQFTCVPAALACLAPRLTSLNMAYNSLRSMSYVTSYPTNLRQLDLSHNEITCWPSLPQVENFGSSVGDPLACYCRGSGAAGAGGAEGGAGSAGGAGGAGGAARPRARPRSGGGVRAQLLHCACAARSHLRLDSLRTLILANNMLERIQLTTDDDGNVPEREGDIDEDDEWNSMAGLRSRLVFPLLSMLDVSCNMLRAVPPLIHALTNLSVLNISGNKEITDLPPQMGLLSRLWNLNTAGCSLHEPLGSMVACGRYKSMDIVGYLKSVLQEARPYTRMKLMLVGLQGIGKTSLLECLRQESPSQYRRKGTDHWALRMGNKASGRNMSTVGVDIGAWSYEPARGSRGPVTFRTWDFGGQREYYATHQYFLSRRSLYLVLWKVTDGRKGLAEAIGWLRSIQARAPGSPVILVATHYDQIANSTLPESESPAALQQLIRSALLQAADADKKGLPRVTDSVEVSCSTKHNIRLLADIIYSVAYSVKPPGSKEPLLEQRVPATYLALEECVTSLAAELREPVLNHDEYKRLVTQYMQSKGHRTFRDAAELHQATMFLHENGVLVHYDDAALKQLYFLRPQWLCDVLAHVVTVREINPFANNGIMKIEDLAHVFKASPLLARGDEASSLGVSLLNKFELALCWDSRTLLVPPLLPDAEPALPQLPLKTRVWPGTPRRVAAALSAAPARADSPSLIQDSPGSISIEGRSTGRALRRLLLLSYIPCGLWARLCSRVLADPAVGAAAAMLYRLPADMELDASTSKALEPNWAWKLWRSGLQLSWGSLVAAEVREREARHDPLLGDSPGDSGRDLRFRVKQEGAWCTLEMSRSPSIEITLPARVCVARRTDGLPLAGYQSISLEPSLEALARLLAVLSDHVDLLLEDWYPSLGTRFVHTSEGRCLITRVVPCAQCLAAHEDEAAERPEHLAQALQRVGLREGGAGGGGGGGGGARASQDSRASDQDSGVGADSAASSRIGSVEGTLSTREEPLSEVHGWTVEQCLLAACTSQSLACPTHGAIPLQKVAPDALLLDVEDDQRARWEHIVLESVAGRGAFGTVMAAVWRPPGQQARRVAVKALQPVPPPRAQHHHAYKVALARWERSPTAGACRAYCGLRQELGVLRVLRHPHVLRLRAVCCAPLALLLEQAPQGALDGILRAYGSMGARVGARAARALALQLARALEYLHAQRVLYRDLKSENVLVWEMPSVATAAAAELSPAPVPVLVKLGDYGISRLAPPSGTKGFGGTEGFMAPEIMRYNGEQEYNEKVDCFSFGMLLYEIVTLRQPFEGHEAVKEAILDGARPSLTPRDLQYPCNILETMRRCWRGAPELRPSAAALVSAAAAPEFSALLDVAAARAAFAAVAVLLRNVTDEGGHGWEVWCGGEPERLHTLLCTEHHVTQQHTVRLPPDGAAGVRVTALCRVGAHVWAGDSTGRVSVYEASTCALLWTARVQDSVGGAPSAVSALQPLPQLRKVALALECGRLFLVRSEREGSCAEAEAEAEAEGGFVLTELGTASELCCLAAVPSPQGFEVWAGGSGLYTYAVTAGGVCGAEELPAAPRVTLLAASPGEPYVALYSHPGVCVYQWSVRSRQQTARLDCSKLVPCSESLQSLALDSRLGEELTRVTALTALGGALYVGTAWGVVIVCACASLRPLAVFRPYEGSVTSIVPLHPHRGSQAAMLATLGTGYRPLLQRYAPQQPNASTTTYSGPHLLLWRAGHWLPD